MRPPRLPGAAVSSVVLSLALSACAGDYVARTRGARFAYEGYDYDRAVSALERDWAGREGDRLLYLLDKGMLLHAAGRWAESNEVLEQAEKLSRQLDIISVSEEAKVLLTSEREKAYRGEDFEKLLVNVLKAMNYSQLGRAEDALVEVRRADARLKRMVKEEQKPYEQLAIARYLGGVLYEDQGEWDSAYIDYAEAKRLAPQLRQLDEPLARLGRGTGRHAEPDRRAAPLGPAEGQLVVVVEGGLAPEKHSVAPPRQLQLVAVPAYRSRRSSVEPLSLAVGEERLEPELVTSVESVARRHLEARLHLVALKSAAASAVKAGVAAGIGKATHSKAAGLAAFLILESANQPDLRSWLSLPAGFWAGRARLTAGPHEVTVSAGGRTTRHAVEIRAGRVSLLVLRRY